MTIRDLIAWGVRNDPFIGPVLALAGVVFAALWIMLP